METTIIHKKEKITINAKDCTIFGKFRGLMFRQKKNAPILLFNFKKQTTTPIHSLFCFFDFLGIWINDKNEIVAIKIVKPWKLIINQPNPFTKLIEIPITKNNKNILKKFLKKYPIN